MRRLVVARSARADLAAIVSYLSLRTRNRSFALQFASRLLAQCSKLATLPGLMGRPRPELGGAIRSFAYRGYVIVFIYRAQTLKILAIIEGHRDIPALFPPDPT